MNQFYLIVVSILLFSNANSQEPFASPGAVWHYEIIGPFYGGFIKVEYQYDTTIQGQVCRKLQPTEYRWFSTGPGTYGTSVTPWPAEFVYQSTDTVFWFTRNQFQVLYNFNAVTGDTWFVTDSMAHGIMDCDSLSFVRVDSTGTTMLSGNTLRYLAVHPDNRSPMGFTGRAYERLGSTNYLFPSFTYCDTGVIVDGPFYRFHCYEDSSFALFVIDTIDCEWWYTLGRGEFMSDKEVTLFPNPSSGLVRIESHRPVESMHVLNTVGEIIYDSGQVADVKSFDLRIDEWSPGVYLIRLQTDYGTFSKKLIRL